MLDYHWTGLDEFTFSAPFDDSLSPFDETEGCAFEGRRVRAVVAGHVISGHLAGEVSRSVTLDPLGPANTVIRAKVVVDSVRRLTIRERVRLTASKLKRCWRLLTKNDMEVPPYDD